MPPHREHHVTLFLPREVAEPIEAMRREWDPVMAAQIAAHVTVVYPEEAPLGDLLVERLRAASPATLPFRLRLAGVGCFQAPEGGVYVGVEHLDGGYRELRDSVLRPPFRASAFAPPITLVHPRTSPRGRELWERGPHPPQDLVFTATEATITAFDGIRWVAPFRFPLGRFPLGRFPLGRFPLGRRESPSSRRARRGREGDA
jgi:2'-5' RNA ligase